jgi:hypothetical protein
VPRGENCEGRDREHGGNTDTHGSCYLICRIISRDAFWPGPAVIPPPG